jgi:hypothetical protein
MKIRDYAQSKLNNMRVPVKFTNEDVERMGGSIRRHGEGDEATIDLGGSKLDTKQLTDPETIALVGFVESIEKAFQQKVSFHREAARFRELASSAVISKEDIQNYGWYTEIVDQDWFYKQHKSEFDDDGVDVTMGAIMAWVTMKLREVSHTSNWFVPSDGLTYKLMATDLKGVVVGDLHLPMASFYVELPEGVFYIDRSDTGWLPVRYLIVTEGVVTEETRRVHKKYELATPVLGKRLLIEMYGSPNQNSKSPFDDMWAFHSYPMDNPMADMEHTITSSMEYPEIERSYLRGRIGERILDGIDIRREVLRFLMNFCVYLGSVDARVEHVHKKEIERLTKGRKFKKLRKNVQERIRKLDSSRVFTVGSDVTIDAEIKDHVLSKSGEGLKLSYRVLVRGHWRNQAHGPKRALRTRRWIMPHVRGTDLPTEVVGHTYDVR